MIDHRFPFLLCMKRNTPIILTFLATASFFSLQWLYTHEIRLERLKLELKRQQTTVAGTLSPTTANHNRGSNNSNWCRTPYEYNRGQWVFDDSADLVPPYWSDPDPVWGPLCTKQQQRYRDSGNQSHLLPDYLRYKWQPHDCQLDNQQWDRHAFCKLLEGKTIGVSGDSMSQQFVHSLMGYTRGTVESHEQFLVPSKVWEGKPSYWIKMRVPLCPQNKDGTTLVYQRWDIYQGKEQDRAALTELIQESDYLVLNWGVHYQMWPDMEKATDDFVGLLEELWRPPHKKPERLFWRSTNVAHANCGMATGPLQSLNSSSNTSFTDATQSVIHDKYGAQEILWQDAYIIKPRLLSKLPKATLLQIEETTLQRPDGHRVEGFNGQEDCLHYCEPGPVDHWAELFYHHLVALEI
jgi:GDSL/SGNH-like Acyl-Esterase family found in Pmr5 and Cas1p